MKKILIILLITLSTLLIMLIHRSTKPKKPVLTPTEWKWLSENEGLIRYTAPPHYPPVSYTDNNLLNGLTEDYAKRFEKILNIKFKRIIFENWDQAIEAAKRGEIDLIGAITKTPERSKYLLFTQPFIKIDSIIVVRKDSPGNLTPAQMKNYTIAVTREYAVEEYLKTNHPYLKLVPVKYDQAGLEKLSFKHVDAVITDLAVATHFIEKSKISNIKIAGNTGFQYQNSFASRKDLPLLNSIIIKSIASIEPKDRINYEKRWINIEYNRFLYSHDFWILISIITAGTILVIVLIKLWDRSLSIMVNRKTRKLSNYKDKLEKIIEEKTSELNESNTKLRMANSEIRKLSGLIPICSNCKKVRDDTGYWDQIENFIKEHPDAEFSHNLCPECSERLYGNQTWYKKRK